MERNSAVARCAPESAPWRPTRVRPRCAPLRPGRTFALHFEAASAFPGQVPSHSAPESPPSIAEGFERHRGNFPYEARKEQAFPTELAPEGYVLLSARGCLR